MICQSEGGAEVFNGNLKTYFKMTDGTWQAGGRNYKYRLVITGRMNNAAVDSTFVYLSNIERITFDQAWKASGLSSHTEDYFSPEEAVLVDWSYQSDVEKEILEYAATEGFVTAESIRSRTPCRIHLSKQKNDAAALFSSTAYDLYIEVDTGTKVLKKELETGVIPITEGSLFFGDIDGDQVQEILVHDDTGGVGGFGLWQTWVLKVEGKALQILFQNFDEFDTGFESRFLEGYQLEVKNRFTGYKQIFDASGYREYIDGSAKLPGGSINLDPFYVFQPRDTDGDGVSEIVCKQYTYILDHADYTGTACSVLKFNKRTQSFEVANAWFEINTDTEYGTPVQPAQITGVTKATLELPHSWNTPRTVTDSETLRKIESILQRSTVLESGAGCLFTGRLTLTLAGSETLVITMSEDNCATWLSEGIYYHYGLETSEGVSGNEELYSLFTAQ